jgi:hypothetical protein
MKKEKPKNWNQVLSTLHGKLSDTEWRWVSELYERRKKEIELDARVKMIVELENIDNKKPKIETHCSCLSYAIFKMKCNCDDECGKCRLKL